MSKVSSSPQRNTFQREKTTERLLEKNAVEELDEWTKIWDTIHSQHETRFDAEDSRVNNLEYDLLTTDWILEKARSSEVYSQNLYCALCNNDFTKEGTTEKWHCSWRYAGGIVADMRKEGDYIDWYCSGIRESYDNGWVSESVVTEEIAEDFKRLGWTCVTEEDEK